MESLRSKVIPTPIGSITAVGDNQVLHALSFHKLCIPSGNSTILDQIEDELTRYFSGELSHFITPIEMDGTHFQKIVWMELLNIPYGKTLTYSEVACLIDKPKATRAVGNANGKNSFVILVPCHRITARASLGGYSQGLDRKKWLIEHEKRNSRSIYF